MTYSNGLKINVNRQNADEALVVLLKIEHPLISNPIFLINDNRDFVLGGDTYIAMPFMIKRQDDIQGELPKATLTISNVGRTLIKWIDMSNGGRNARITIQLARRSSQLIEESIEFGIQSINLTTESITFNLIIQNNIVKRSVRWVYDINHARGLF